MRLISIFISISVLFLCGICVATTREQPVDWQTWTPDIFHRAEAEHKFVLLDLGTQWCHWCHVMDVQTYADPRVRKLIAEKYIAVRMDADERPDFGNRYEDYGWPATVVYNAQGGEIVKRQGFLSPGEMASMLAAIIADPTPGPSVTPTVKVRFGDQDVLSKSVYDELMKRHLETYDWQQGSWGHGQKFLDWNNTEWAMRLAKRGDAGEEQMARQTLTQQLNLLDPAWGGVYQYSTDDDWQHPHFEKIMQMQAQDMRIYSMVWSQWHDPTYLHTAEAIHHFLTRFMLDPAGGFYTSMDADLVDGVHSADYFKLSDAQRVARGIPRIDKHEYARENGWVIGALADLYEYSGDESALSHAIAAANWVRLNRSTNGGGFVHDQADSAFYLGDTLAMGQAFLQLYEVTADRDWLMRAEQAADFISAHFIRGGEPGIMTADVHGSGMFAPQQEFDENVEAARWANLLGYYSGRDADKALAKTAMMWLATPEVALRQRVNVGGVLLAGDEMTLPPLHITVIGGKSDVEAGKMFRLAEGVPTFYKRVEWYDLAEGPLPNPDIPYPHFSRPAAFVCTATACSSPAFSVATLEARLGRVKY